MPGKTLAASLPTLITDVTKCAQEAMKEAILATAESGDSVDPTITATIKADLEILANKIALKFASKLAPSLAQAIYAFVSEIGITLIPKGTLIAPQAPAGALPITGVASTTTQDITVL